MNVGVWGCFVDSDVMQDWTAEAYLGLACESILLNFLDDP
jgi:hypothetical protein